MKTFSFIEMLKIYNRVGLYNHTFECLKSGDDAKVSYAISRLKTLKSEDDVCMFIALNV